MSKCAVLLYIGQSPRPDIFNDVRALVPQDIDLIQAGALDGLSAEEIASMGPENEEDVLITKLRNGSTVTVSEKAVGKLLLKKTAELSGQAELFALLCTGAFEQLSTDKALIKADTAFHEKMSFEDNIKTLGVLVPMEEQRNSFGKLYAPYGKKVVTAAADPYGPCEKILEAAWELKKAGADCICADCMGYDGKTADMIESSMGLPVRIPRNETAKLITEYFKK